MERWSREYLNSACKRAIFAGRALRRRARVPSSPCNINAGERFLICTVRKSDLCRCGCGGLCTLTAMMDVVVWSFNIAAAGVWPSTRHDGQELDEDRANLAGTPLAGGARGVLVEYRADLLEFTTACGFKKWENKRRPCFLCTCSRDQLHDYPADFSSAVWEPLDHARLEEQVRDAVKDVDCDEEAPPHQL